MSLLYLYSKTTHRQGKELLQIIRVVLNVLKDLISAQEIARGVQRKSYQCLFVCFVIVMFYTLASI